MKLIKLTHNTVATFLLTMIVVMAVTFYTLTFLIP